MRKNATRDLKHARLSSFVVGMFAFALFLAGALPASAAATCPTTETLNGGTHCSYEVPDKGIVHVWKSPGYQPTAPIIVYQHGDTNSTDATWVEDRLPEQFAASSVQGLYIVPRGPKCGPQNDPPDPTGAHCGGDIAVRWSSLTDLLDSVKGTMGEQLPTGPIMFISYSNAIRTTKQSGWIGNSDVRGVIALDTMFGGSSSYIAWLKASADHKMILVGKNTVLASKNVALSVPDHVIKTSFAYSPSGPPGPDFPGLSAAEASAQAIYLQSPVSHLYMPENLIKILLPILANSAGVAGGSAAGPAEASAGGGAATAATTKPPGAPVLDIPIPFVNFSGGANDAGILSLPFLSQYISGVYTFALSVVGLVAAVMLIIGGFQYLTSAGDKSKIADGKKRITDALIGMVLAFGSYILLYTINPALVRFQGLQIGSVETELRVDAGVAPQPGEYVPATGAGDFQLFLQCDKRWGEFYPNDGVSGWTIDGCDKKFTLCQRACGTTSLAMVLAHYGIQTDPIQTAQWGLGCRGGWKPVDTLKGITNRWPGITAQSFFKPGAAAMAKLLPLIKQGKPIIYNCSPCHGLHADGTTPTTSLSGHYVVLTSYNPVTNSFTVNDPGNRRGIVSYDYDRAVADFNQAVYVHPIGQ